MNNTKNQRLKKKERKKGRGRVHTVQEHGQELKINSSHTKNIIQNYLLTTRKGKDRRRLLTLHPFLFYFKSIRLLSKRVSSKHRTNAYAINRQRSWRL